MLNAGAQLWQGFVFVPNFQCHVCIYVVFSTHDYFTYFLFIIKSCDGLCSVISVERLFQEANIPMRGEVPYEPIIQTLLTPMPDYGHGLYK